MTHIHFYLHTTWWSLGQWWLLLSLCVWFQISHPIDNYTKLYWRWTSKSCSKQWNAFWLSVATCQRSCARATLARFPLMASACLLETAARPRDERTSTLTKLSHFFFPPFKARESKVENRGDSTGWEGSRKNRSPFWKTCAHKPRTAHRGWVNFVVRISRLVYHEGRS